MADEEKKESRPSFGPWWFPLAGVAFILLAFTVVAWERGNLTNVSSQGFLQAPLPPAGSGETYTPSGYVPITSGARAMMAQERQRLQQQQAQQSQAHAAASTSSQTPSPFH